MSCINIPKLAYSAFSDYIHKKYASENVILNVAWEITYHCNLRCSHCYIGEDFSGEELDKEAVYHILDKLIDTGCLWLLFTGGEPFLRQDFLEIYTYAKKKGFIITIFTNGTLIDRQIAHYLKQNNPFSIEVSLYGVTPETYERITGVAGSYERCLRAIHLLLEKNLPLKLKTVISKINRDEVIKIKEFVESLGMRFCFDQMLCPDYRGIKNPDTFRLSAQEVADLDMRFPEERQEWRRIWREFGRQPPSKDLFDCPAGLSSFDIDPYGMVRICSFVRQPVFDLKTSSLQEYWREFLPQIRAKTKDIRSPCLGCRISVLCDQCPGWSLLEKKDIKERVEYLCEVAHLRFEALKSLYKGGKRYAVSQETLY